MSFSEERLPARLAFGSTGGVERRTQIVTLGSGFEQRSTPWAHGRRRFLIGAGVSRPDDAAALVAFFEARRGRLTGFRFRDFADNSAGDAVIGHGDASQRSFQLCKTYGEGPGAYVRPIRKPVAGTVQVAVAGVALGDDAFAVDAATGLVTLSTAPAGGAIVTASFQFDTPVRFDADRIDVTLESFDAVRVAAITLVEVRV